MPSEAPCSRIFPMANGRLMFDRFRDLGQRITDEEGNRPAAVGIVQVENRLGFLVRQRY